MNTIINTLKSRTVWTIIALFVINGIGGIHDLIPTAYLPVIDLLLSGLAIYFRISPRQQFNA